MGEFGEKFRKAREAKGISLENASNVTKINSRMLLAIEEEHFDQLPGGVFTKGFIRAYAKHLGINDQEAVTEYLECLRQEEIKAQAAWLSQVQPSAEEKPPSGGGNHRSPKTPNPSPTDELPDLQLPRAEDVRLPLRKYLDRGDEVPWRLLAAAALVIVLAILLWRRPPSSSGEKAASPPPAPPVSTVAVTAAPALPEPVPASAPPAGKVTDSAPAPVPVPTNPVLQSTSPSAAGATAASTVKPAADDEENDVAALSVSVATAAKPASPLTLVIRASENSWISVSADGQAASHETLIAPARTSVHAEREIVAKVGNAAGVSFVWNGKEIPAQGEEAEVKTFVFDAQGMHVIAASLAPPPPSQ